MKYTLILLLAFLLLSCGERSEKSTKFENGNDEVLDTNAIAEVDTVAIEQKILLAFAEQYTYFDDSLQKEMDAIHYNAVIDCKLNFNGDEWLDYFVTDGYGGGVSMGYFYDGKTGDLIEGKTDDDYIASGPARDIQTRLIDVDLEDNQQELVVITGGGGSLGLYYYCDIYQFDLDLNVFRNIFSETISSVNWEPEDSPHYVNYIDLFYSNSLFMGDFIVQKGVQYETDDYDPLAIRPLKESQQYHYVYESYFDEFRIDRVTCIGQEIKPKTVQLLARINDWNEWDKYPDELLDIVDKVGVDLEQQMKKGILTITDDTEYVNFTASKDGRVNMVTYTFPSGGTAGTIHHPILQWQKVDGSFATQVLFPQDPESEHFNWEVNFYDIQKLPHFSNDLYVIVGTRKGSSSHFSACAMVIELKDDSLILDYPAFSDAYSVLIFTDDINDGEQPCIACMDYDPKKKTITIEEMGEADHMFVMENSINPKEREIEKKGIVIWEFKNGKFVLQE